jgi:hypothetical protein
MCHPAACCGGPLLNEHPPLVTRRDVSPAVVPGATATLKTGGLRVILDQLHAFLCHATHPYTLPKATYPPTNGKESWTPS